MIPIGHTMNQRLLFVAHDMRREYNPSKLKGGIRGKYYQRAKAGTNLVLIDADLARLFPDSESVNRALRLLVDMARAATSSRR